MSWLLKTIDEGISQPSPLGLRLMERSEGIMINTGAATFRVDRTRFPFGQVFSAGQELTDHTASQVVLTDAKGRVSKPEVTHFSVENSGPVRATFRFEGVFGGSARLRFVARVCYFWSTSLVRLRFTCQNPRRARHRGGLWDLGGTGSIRFRDLSLEVALAARTLPTLCWKESPDSPVQRAEAGNLELYQDSSGGENWQSKNHIDSHGHVPVSFRGYRVRVDSQEHYGLRASPVICLHGSQASMAVAVPEFWQQFPKAIEADGRGVRVRLFPIQFADLFELQGGEQKTHTVWFDICGRPKQTDRFPLDWVSQPVGVHASLETYAQSGTIPYLMPVNTVSDLRAGRLLYETLSGTNSLFARRELIDEYGWRSFGDFYADHEAVYYQGPPPIISHYNNQYDCIYGTLFQYLSTGNHLWLALGSPLARHVADIDIYHTQEDKAAYNGGLFWPTDHYKDAATATHRTYSRANCHPGDRTYGGGPCNEHNYTTGLMHYYLLTGSPQARDAVLGLAKWVLDMDDGRKNILGLVDDGPTGHASSTRHPTYHGPGRGCGNSVNALLDAWLLTNHCQYLQKAEQLIRRSVHPADDVSRHDLLNVEERWSYTVFLSVLARYLQVKSEADQIDFMYAYARASLLQYADWMLNHEVPYFDRPDQLEYPTETWAAQELRKANVFRLAAAHADEPKRSRLIRRGDELAERAWSDLDRFPSRTVTRSVALLMIEGPRDVYFREYGVPVAPRPLQEYDFGKPACFVSQCVRVKKQLKSMHGFLRAIIDLVDYRRWRRLLVARRDDPSQEWAGH
jgi:hypothetical protein